MCHLLAACVLDDGRQALPFVFQGALFCLCPLLQL